MHWRAEFTSSACVFSDIPIFTLMHSVFMFKSRFPFRTKDRKGKSVFEERVSKLLKRKPNNNSDNSG